jgi:quinol-cytochrome oxidoreductase complex cytochrome b subunit
MAPLRLSGWLILLSLALAVLSGIVLATSYLPVPELAYDSVVDLESATAAGAARPDARSAT